jgi:type IV pilus assembly protein PilM
VFRRAKALVGLDIGSSAVKAVELKPSGKTYKVTGFGTEPLPPDSIVDGAIIDGAAVADAIRRLFDARGIKTKDAFALQNAYEANYGIDPSAVVVLLNAGASATNINILQGDQSVFTRDISMGGNAYTEALQRELNLPFDIADALKRGEVVEGATYDDARPVLRAVTENVMLEIQKTFDFFKATAASDRIDRIMLSGGASRAEGFTEMLAERFEAPVEPFDPFKKVAFDAKKFNTESSEIAPTVAVAVGLALRRSGDR